jgi:hypothetical protein
VRSRIIQILLAALYRLMFRAIALTLRASLQYLRLRPFGLALRAQPLMSHQLRNEIVRGLWCDPKCTINQGAALVEDRFGLIQ